MQYENTVCCNNMFETMKKKLQHKSVCKKNHQHTLLFNADDDFLKMYAISVKDCKRSITVAIRRAAS